MVYFKWANYACTQDPRPPLFINLDETSLAYAYPQTRGTVIIRKHLPKGRSHKPQRYKLGDLRGHVTYLGFVCNESTVQPELPQILIGNEHFFTLKSLAKAKPHLPKNVYVWREKSAWSNHKTMRRAFKKLREALYYCTERWGRNVIIVMDTHRSHLHRTISQMARLYGFQVMYALALDSLNTMVTKHTGKSCHGMREGFLKHREPLGHG